MRTSLTNDSAEYTHTTVWFGTLIVVGDHVDILVWLTGTLDNHSAEYTHTTEWFGTLIVVGEPGGYLGVADG